MMRKTCAMAGGITTVLLLLLGVVPGTVAAQQSAESQQTPASAPGAVIPVAEVAAQATEVTTLLRTLRAQVVPSPAIDTIHRVLPEVSGTIGLELAATSTMLQGQPALEVLQTQQQLWQRRHLQTTGWLHVLTGQATHLQEVGHRLTALHTTWTATRTAAQQAPEPILQQIDATLAAIAAVQAPLEAQRVAVLDLQSHVAHEVARCERVLAQIAQVQQQTVTGMLVRDGLPLWHAALWTEARTALPEHVRQVATASWSDSLRYVRDPAEGLPLHAGLCLVLALAFGAARRQSQRWQTASEAASSALSVFQHPVAAALLVTLLIATSPFAQIPFTVREVLDIVGFLPMLLLTQPVVAASVVPGLYALGGLFALDIVLQAFAVVPRLGQVLLVGETLVGSIVAGWMLGHLRRAPGATARPSGLSALRRGTWLFVLTFAAGLVASSLGYGRLARFMTSGILVGGILALTLAASFRVLNGVLACALRLWPLQALHLVRQHRDRLERRLSRVLVWMATLGWVVRYLNYIGLLEPVLASGYVVLTAKLERGTLSLSVGDVLAFGLTVLGAYLLSAFLRFVLDEDVYPRTSITSGQSYAVSSLLHYVILALGCVVGLGVLGVDMSRVTVLASAFGVGIGFGMQSVVNNFVSGLILLFERPIHVGDAVELGALQGVVRRIGIRASVVHTLQGADIIVPNSQLVTEQVTNWTLTDQLRRIDLPVGVNYGAVPQHVIALLETVARAHPQVLPEPPPQAFFMGYGDSAINFTLLAWPDHFNHWLQVKSDLTTAVYEAVSAAGMSFPFPQREVRMAHEVEVPQAREPLPHAAGGGSHRGKEAM
jgi:potassium-dependent mechanosensitive channel